MIGTASVGMAVLDTDSLHVLYANPYLLAHLDEPWCNQDVRGQHLAALISAPLFATVQPFLQHVATTGQPIQQAEVAYEGFLETRGRTYWRVAVERIQPCDDEELLSTPPTYLLLLTLEDVTEAVRARLHLNAIHYISSALAGPGALHLVLERLLQVLQEMFGSKRCAVLLIDQALPTTSEGRSPGSEEAARQSSDQPHSATIAAQQGIHPLAQDWHPRVDERILLGRVLQEGHTLIVSDTSTLPDIELPLLDHKGQPCRPGSVLCVPIFEPQAGENEGLSHEEEPEPYRAGSPQTVLGTIEVYHRRARGFPAEEVKLLERFARQAGLAIQNARLFRNTERWARTASRNVRQKEHMMQAIPDGVVIYDPRWRVADTNYAARMLFGWSDDVVGLPIQQAFERCTATFLDAGGHPTAVVAELEQRALHGQVDEFKMRGANGHTYTIRCSYTPIRDDQGDIFAFILTYHDVTEATAARERIEAEVRARTAELKQRNTALQIARAALELTNARMTLLLEQLPSGVILVSAADATISMMNRHAVRLLQSMGVPLEPLADPETASKQAIGKPCQPLLEGIALYTTSGIAVPYQEQPLYAALVHGETGEAELHTTRPDGQTLYLLVTAAPLLAADGEVSSAILVMQEITRIKELERAREDFFTTMAHELKTPLANIRAHLSALLARDLQWSSEEQYDFLQTADEQVDRLVGMINHFLDASRVEAGALRLELEPILIPELLEDLEERLEALIVASRRSLRLEVPPRLPAVLGDYELIISVLSNLLSNAFRYAPEGDAVLLQVTPIFAQTARRPIAVQFSVTDRGPGISPEQQAALFTRFSTFAAMSRPSQDRPGQPMAERQHRSTRWSPATGLGLYISRGIVEAHNSKLLLSSSPGQGATFTFTLPVFREQHGQGKHASAHKNMMS